MIFQEQFNLPTNGYGDMHDLLECDTRPRRRTVVVTVLGE